MLYFEGVKTTRNSAYVMKTMSDAIYPFTCGMNDDKDCKKMTDNYKLKAILGIGKSNQLQSLILSTHNYPILIRQNPIIIDNKQEQFNLFMIYS